MPCFRSVIWDSRWICESGPQCRHEKPPSAAVRDISGRRGGPVRHGGTAPGGSAARFGRHEIRPPAPPVEPCLAWVGTEISPVLADQRPIGLNACRSGTPCALEKIPPSSLQGSFRLPVSPSHFSAPESQPHRRICGNSITVKDLAYNLKTIEN